MHDDEYVRNGVAEIFIEVEPLGGKRHVEITKHRKKVDWTYFIKGMLDERFPEAAKVILVMDNLTLTTHPRFMKHFHRRKRGDWLKDWKYIHTKTRELAQYR